MTDQQMSKINSAEHIHEYLKQQYRIRIIKIEMELHKARQTRMDNNVQRYFNSTPIRNAFARWMVYGAYVNKFYTISELVNELHTNRQTISTIIKECEEYKFIIVKRTSNTTTCQAAPLLIEKMEDYCDWRRNLAKDTVVNSLLTLTSFEELMQNDLSLNELKT
mgnify:FL=1|tara:strand:+ start:938 stop:1429 length:492 start_codon:yes stop_codon:yes gene_type:complete